MTDPMQSEVAAALARVRELESQQARAQGAVEQAEDAYNEALMKLNDEFGISSSSEARALLEKLDAELASELKKINEALAVANPEEG